jgi:serine/threonine-protein kinase RsbW
MSDTVVRLTFPAKADYLLLARLALSGLARSVPIDAELLADLKLAVTEACGNAVRHAYRSSEGSVRVDFVLADDRLDMIVEDHGSGIGLVQLEELVVDRPMDQVVDGGHAVDGGMGMAIIKAIVDELDVRDGSDGRGTVVHMTKYLATAPSPSS